MKKIKLGIIGLGRLGRKHAENIYYNIPEAELSAICSVVPEELDTVKREMSPDMVSGSYEELIRSKELDGLVVSTNSQTHSEIICAAAEAGVKNVYTEKPLGMSFEEINKIKDAVESNPGMKLQVGYNHRFDADLRAVKEKIDAGYVGNVVLIRMASRDQLWDEEQLVKFSPSSGGLVADMMTHDYDTARWLTGSEADTIFGLGDVYAYEGLKAVGDIDNAVLLMKFKNGVMVQLEGSRNSAVGYHAPLEVFGSKGSISVGDHAYSSRITWLNEAGAHRDYTQWFFEYWEPTYLAELKDFVDSIMENRPPLVGLYDGYKAVEWAFVAAKALEKGEIVKMG
ncbi:MAG: Gfo/Idh/MocA family oxidoreductase [Spirochaetaceae bacterium]